MNTWKVVLATLVIFVAGILTGAMLVRSSMRMKQIHQRAFMQQPAERVPPSQMLREPREVRPPVQSNAPSQFMRREFSVLLQGELRLTHEQREQIERIMAEGQERIQKTRQQIEPEIRREMTESRDRMREVLTPEQRQRFEQLMKQRLQRRNDEQPSQDRRPRMQQQFRDQPPGPGPRPPFQNP